MHTADERQQTSSGDFDTTATDAALNRQRRRSYGVAPAWHSIRHKLGEKLLMPERPWVDLGLGFNFDLDDAELLPKVTVCAQ